MGRKVPIVDYWELYNNTLETELIANSYEIIDEEKFNSIYAICQRMNVAK